MKLAVLYAGQGAQHPGMGKEFYESSPAFRAAFDSAALNFDLHRVCFEDPDGVLNQTEYTQPCMVAFACGVTAVLAEHGVQPDVVAGLSLGEYSALEAAGVFTAKQAIELAAYRGKAMADAARGIDCGMTAVLGLDRTALSACCEEAAALGCVQICNYNCPGQLVIGGEQAAVDKAAALAAFEHTDEQLSRVEHLRETREATAAWLKEQTYKDQPLEVAESGSNFLLFGGHFDKREAIFDELLKRGVLIRVVGPDGWLRVCMGTDEEMETFRNALVEVLRIVEAA